MQLESNNKINNFDFLRIALASVVVVVHIYELSDIKSLKFIADIFSSYVAVKCFFVISGYLIFMSYDRSKSLGSYFRNRIFRILPAYFFVIIFSAFFLTAIFGQFSFENGFDIFRYIFWNLLFLNFMAPNLPGVFSENTITAVNGALWTLKIEVMFYITVPIICYMFSRLERNIVLILIFIMSLLYVYTFDIFFHDSQIAEEMKRQLPGQMSYFVMGAILYYNFDNFIKIHIPLAVLSIIFLVFVPDILIPVAEPIALGIITIAIAHSVYLGPWAKYGDFSYGVYITHFPVIQTLVALGVAKREGWVFATSAILLTLAISVCLWHGIEKRYLKRAVRKTAT